MNPYIEIIRPTNSFLAGLGVIVSIFIATKIITITPISIFAFLTVFFITSAGNVANDCFDIKTDRINKSYRPLPSGRLTEKNAKTYMYLLFAAGIVSSAYINQYTIALALFNSIMLLKYNSIKKSTPFGSLVIGSLIASIFIYGGLAAGNLSSLILIGLIAGVSNIAREITKDIEDIKADKGRKVTIPTLFGAKKSSHIVAFILLITIALSLHPQLLTMFTRNYLPIILMTDIIFIISASILVYNPIKHAPKVRRLEKIAMFIALAAFCIGTI